jgi:hypothetical protein
MQGRSHGTPRILTGCSSGYYFGTASALCVVLAHAHACAADYVLGTANTNACLAGAAKLTTAAECIAAAMAVGKLYGGAFSEPLRPSGCFLDTGDGKVYFNPSAPGAVFASAQPLCVFGAPRVCCVLTGLIQKRRGDGAALTRAVVRCSCAATYATSFAKTNVCLAGSVKITMQVTCEAAAAALGKQYASSAVDRSDRPSGCFVTSGGLVYFNTDSTGGTFATAQPLCYVTGAPPQTAAAHPNTPQG